MRTADLDPALKIELANPLHKILDRWPRIREPHNCGHCHGCKAELRNAKHGAAQMCPNLDCERVFTEAYRNLHGQDESPYQGRCPQVLR